jgi:hypothetical protein
MSIRIGFGVRIAPHMRAYVSAPLFGHARRIAGHQGHAEQQPGALAWILAFLFVCWCVGKCTGGPDAP